MKVKGALFSHSASGKIGPRVVFSVRESGQQVRIQKAQKDFSSSGRTTQRNLYKGAVNGWNALTDEQKEEYKTRAKNLNLSGYNLYVKENIGVTPATVPDAPTSLGGIRGNTEVALSWTAPAYDGGSALTDYLVEYKLNSEPTTWSTFSHSPSTTTSITVTGLTNGSLYNFRVSAVNSVGASVPSSTVNATPATVPDAPTIGTATRGNAQVSVAFTPPSNNGGSAITGYTVYSNTGGFSQSGASSPIVVTGLSNGTAYTFTVKATNAVGDSSASSASNSATPATVPDAPTIGTATAGNAEASVAFTAPSNNGGSAITGYTVTSSPSGITASGASSPIVVTGLSNGTAYTFTVKATNAVGDSSASSASNSATPVAPKLLDTYPTSGCAFSLRLLRNSYTGYCLRVRRSSDNAEQDIGFVAGELDTSSMLSFCGSSNGFIVKWYDQGSAGNDLVQSTAGSQPQIVTAGSLYTINGKTAVYVNATWMALSSSIAGGSSGSFSSFQVLKRTGTTVIGPYLGSSTGVSGGVINCLEYQDNTLYIQSENRYTNGGTVGSNQHLWATFQISNTFSAYLNNSSYSLGSSQTFSGNSNFGAMGKYASSTPLSASGYLQELIIYTSDQTANRSAIDSDINSYYAIY